MPPVRPLLKWAGGKRQLLPFFRRFYPSEFTRYIEPFLGSAAVFFDLYNQQQLRGRPVILADSNRDLIGCYAAVRDECDQVLAELRRLADGHHQGGAAHYYRIRDQFNGRRLDSSGRNGGCAYSPGLAAMLIYLNRTGYNGLFRLNAEGRFNVPVGRYANPRIYDAALVRSVSDALAGSVSLTVAAFEAAVEEAHEGDFFYFDPPYAPLSPTAAFAAYTAARFSDADQKRLCDLVVSLARRGCAVMLSNSSAPAVAKLYQRATCARGTKLTLWEVPARRAINSRGALRGPVTELLLTNLTPRSALPPRSPAGGRSARDGRVMADSDSAVRGR